MHAPYTGAKPSTFKRRIFATLRTLIASGGVSALDGERTAAGGRRQARVRMAAGSRARAATRAPSSRTRRPPPPPALAARRPQPAFAQLKRYADAALNIRSPNETVKCKFDSLRSSRAHRTAVRIDAIEYLYRAVNVTPLRSNTNLLCMESHNIYSILLQYSNDEAKRSSSLYCLSSIIFCDQIHILIKCEQTSRAPRALLARGHGDRLVNFGYELARARSDL
ncbi:hypothetical protein EVAR_59302_1 [Eumeta japonica]|uniref:Uncharacterized protein n=1 Tax=Eumeta variegata TaxID=151549 RepID=A0A4C1Y992_EUMVA|nr:hypothetical protein EVAR_59302_1 [Eumeta japonica]